jgi:hypothetical protein
MNPIKNKLDLIEKQTEPDPPPRWCYLIIIIIILIGWFTLL